MDKRDFAFDKVNYILLAIGMAVVLIRLYGNGLQS